MWGGNNIILPSKLHRKFPSKTQPQIKYDTSWGWRRTKSMCLHKMNHPLHVDAHFDDTSSTCLLFVGPPSSSTFKIPLRVPSQHDDVADIVDALPGASGAGQISLQRQVRRGKRGIDGRPASLSSTRPRLSNSSRGDIFAIEFNSAVIGLSFVTIQSQPCQSPSCRLAFRLSASLSHPSRATLHTAPFTNFI